MASITDIAIETGGEKLLVEYADGTVAFTYATVHDSERVIRPFEYQSVKIARALTSVALSAGDRLKRYSDGQRYLAVSVNDVSMLGRVEYKDALFMRCNISGELWRYSGEADTRGRTIQQTVRIGRKVSGVITPMSVDERSVGGIAFSDVDARLLLPQRHVVRGNDVFIASDAKEYRIKVAETISARPLRTCLVQET